MIWRCLVDRATKRGSVFVDMQGMVVAIFSSKKLVVRFADMHGKVGDIFRIFRAKRRLVLQM